MNTVNKTKFCAGLSDISDSYMGFIIDQWGVLHNGEAPYEGVTDCLKELKARKKTIIILSNSGKRAEENKQRLKELGIGPSLYDTIVTSGEMAWQGLERQDSGFFKGLGRRCCLITRGGDRSIVDGLDIEVVENPDDADFLLIAGSDAPHKTLEDYEPILKAASRRRLTALCANPDSRGILGRDYVMGPGTLAARYRDFGGVVHYIGKPHQPIFEECLKLLREKNIYPGQTVMVGDSMSHDILGGSLANIDTCMVKCGLHAHIFSKDETLADADKSLNILINQFNQVRPKYLLDSLKWGKALPDRKHKKRAAGLKR